MSPGFTAIALFSLALGIGANTAIFSLANAIIFRDTPLEAPEEVIHIYKRMEGFSAGPISLPDLDDIRNSTEDIFEGTMGARYTFAQVDQGDRIEGVMGELVTGNYFTLQGIGAHIGRTLLPEDDISPGGHYVVMLGYGYWKREFGGDPGVLGSTIRLNGSAYEIVGVVPRDYPGHVRGFAPQIFAPLTMNLSSHGPASIPVSPWSRPEWHSRGSPRTYGRPTPNIGTNPTN
jgi:hypothetical protein